MALVENGGMNPAEVALLAGNNRNNGGFGDGNGSWWILLLFLFAMNGGWGNGGL